jgi:predicted AlkP superfamily phosphohydrolase/phosphomutase
LLRSSAADPVQEKSPIVLIGLDALDPDLARVWAAAGELPVLAGLLARGAQAEVRNPFGLFVGALWVSFASSLRAHRHGFHCWEGIDVATYAHRAVTPKPERYRSFWARIGDAGRRVAAIDVPHSRAAEPLNGVEIAEWGTHDRHFGFHASPPARADAIEAEIGLQPVFGIDARRAREFAPDDVAFRAGHYRTPAEDAALTDALVRGAAAKGRLTASLLAEEDWDLFLSVFGEAHAAGHQLWHRHDALHPRFDSALGGDPLLQVYKAIDEALGRVLEAAPPQADLLIVLSHGMRAHYDGTHLLAEVLARLDRPSLARRIIHPALGPLAALARAVALPDTLRRRAGSAMRGEGPRALARRRFFAEPNNTVYGGIRLNLIGREPSGTVAPEDADRLCAEIERWLLELVNVETGRPAVRAVVRAERDHVRTPGDSIPDLFVEWDHSAPTEIVRSPRIGTVRIPYTLWRTGDHSPEGLLVAAGPAFAAGAREPLDVEDIGASIAARLGCPMADIDGRIVPWLAGEARSSPISSPGLSTAAAHH